MALCTTLQNKVFDLEKTKTTQHNEIASLKIKVKKLEKKNMSRTHKLKRLCKVGLTARVESSDNEESLEMFDVNVLDGEEVFVAEQEVAANKENDEVNVVSTAAATTTTDDDGDITLAQALIEIKSTKPKKKGIVIQELDQILLDEETALKLQAEFDEEERLARERAEKEKKPILP
ncbi:hypothetical protein Tco_1048522 [Tanacetum coccineum]